MAKISLGILDGFIGKVGTVVGSFWKGKPVMRGYKRFVHNAKTSAQRAVRNRFATLVSLASVFKEAIAIGFRREARSHVVTEGNVFVTNNWGSSQASAGGTVTVNYPQVVIARGGLDSVTFGTPHFDNPFEVTVAFTPINEHANASDLVYLFLYSPDINQGLLSTPVQRSAGSISVTVPNNWNGLKVHVWGFTQGANDPTKVSNSSYVGSGNIA